MATIGEAEAKQILSFEETKARCLLAELMSLGPYKDERNIQDSIKVDFYYDSLKFAADKGFPWEQVCSIVQFAEEFLATATDKTITEAVHLYQVQSPNLLLELGERNYKVYSDYLFSSFFTHFQLYKLVLAHPRRENIPELKLDVHPPVPPLPLPESKELSVWRYEQTLEELDRQELELCKKRLHHSEQISEETSTKKAAAQAKVETTETPFTKDTLGEMMRSLLKDYAEATGKAISTNIKDVREDLEVKLQKTSVPRPAVLGPPPRCKPKSPVHLASKGGVSGPKQDKKNKNNSNTGEKSPKSPKSPAPAKTQSPKSSARSRTSSRGSKR